ncbi:hypothetical protein TrRE_jg13150 [Triparma retinervis]|uniref:Fatty acid hydroxylase domain-containing protein n=1 Tax=Triparma retinervis TaxID=2557542 RepID=A0A9W6ZUK0_9STRA|nr:hypothetical protein TrRE_jg13150 [Triparma retinervis]
MFPLGVPDQISDASVDLLGVAYLSISIPFFVACILIENFIIFFILPEPNRPPHTARFADSICSVGLGILQVLAARLLFLQWMEPLYTLVYDHLRVTDSLSDSTKPFTWWACLIIADFLYYWFHRLSHEISWMWTTHAVHHSSEEYNLTTALRQPALDFLAPSFIISSVLAAILFPWPLFSAHATFNLLYQFWIHTQLIPPLPLVETVFNTPSLHRIHHGRNIRALGKNYGAILIVWDRMFGTYEPEIREEDDTKLYYGIIPQLRSYDPIFANVHHFYHMVMIQTKWQKWWEVPFRHWTPNNAKCPEVSKDSKMNPASKFDPQPPTLRWKIYAYVQFALLLFSVGVYLLFDDDEAICKFLFGPGLDVAWGKAFVAIFIVSLALWALSDVSAICTLGVKGTTSTRRSLLRSECARHTVIVLSFVICAILPDSEPRLFFTIASLYTLFNLSSLLMLRNELDEGGGADRAIVTNIVFADAESGASAPLIADGGGGGMGEAKVSDWTWYGGKKYQ